MELRYPSDFMRTRPWGKVGDRKNDGYLASKRMLFQLYAPNEMKAHSTIKKITEDFDGAKTYWQKHFDTWVFAHNSRIGLSPQINEKLLELRSTQPPNVLWWGYAELRQEVLQLKETDLIKLFGVAPTRINMLRVGYENLKEVLAHISRQPQAQISVVLTVPPDKLLYNQLSTAVQQLIGVGMQRSDKVDQFFQGWHDPTYGDGLAQTFTLKYQELKSSGFSPDRIFFELQAFAAGDRRLTPEGEAAILTVLAYFFEKCDIFERPAKELQ